MDHVCDSFFLKETYVPTQFSGKDTHCSTFKKINDLFVLKGLEAANRLNPESANLWLDFPPFAMTS